MTHIPSTLLVEDDIHLASTLANDFSDHGVTVDRAHDWDQGLKSFRTAGHELVVADYNLPGSDHGLVLLLQIKVRMPSTKLVLMSGALTEQAEAELAPLGLVDAYVRKSSHLGADLLPWAVEAAERAKQPTNWTGFADGYLADTDRQFAEVERINEILRASLTSDDA